MCPNIVWNRQHSGSSQMRLCYHIEKSDFIGRVSIFLRCFIQIVRASVCLLVCLGNCAMKELISKQVQILKVWSYEFDMQNWETESVLPSRHQDLIFIHLAPVSHGQICYPNSVLPTSVY